MSSDESSYSDEEVAEFQEQAFIAGAQQMREMLARFVEQGGTAAEKNIAISIRANWVPAWGEDPGKPEDIYSVIADALP